ncbi:MAG: HU family DNA-binding protein [Nitrospirota bacterium]|uniref:Transcriptional regulator n=1 Tax=Candidatus Magnetominusculus xianensis TaxID=1748249 RepID=A0ABR5SDD3_9BACT|nr:HU family DNA-binding protein [Candidatus Magnetominusculus xianensis]KWT79384.1 transcriptional regulator [Candidatus Magnetominusculus xianensis]MBF0405491.1 HU family DNA-binding protein [Nitrospirota bacterium]
MSKVELIEKMAKDANLSKADAGRALDAAIAAIIDTLKQGQKLTLVGFGTFSVSKRKARDGRNPRTGDVIKIPEAIVPKFVPGMAFKDAVNKK